MSEGTPARIDRAALERIIQRAAELQTAERDIGEELTPDEVLALGSEVGIPGRYLQQALLEERTRLGRSPPPGPVRAGGRARPGRRPAGGARRPSPASRQALLGWMEEKELFCVQRRQPGRITWEPLGGMAGGVPPVHRGVQPREAPLSCSPARTTVSATVVALEPGWCHVALVGRHPEGPQRVRRRPAPRSPGPGWPAPALWWPWARCCRSPCSRSPWRWAWATGWLRRYRPALARIQLGLERALDQLEQGGARRSVSCPDRQPGSWACWPMKCGKRSK